MVTITNKGPSCFNLFILVHPALIICALIDQLTSRSTYLVVPLELSTIYDRIHHQFESLLNPGKQLDC